MASVEKDEGEPAAKRQRTSAESASPISIVVTGLAGPLCTVQGSSNWTILQVQEAIREKCKIPVFWQSLVQGERKLELEEKVAVPTSTAQGTAGELHLSMVKQEPSVASLRKRLQKDPKSCCRDIAEALVLILLNGSRPRFKKARHCLLELARAHPHQVATEPEALEAFVSLLPEGCNLRRKCGAEALVAIAGVNGGSRAIACIPRALPLLVALFMNGGPKGKEMAAQAIGKMWWNSRINVEDTLEAGKMLVGLLKTGDKQEQRMAATTLGTLARHAQGRVRIAGIPDVSDLLVALRSQGDVPCQQAAIRALRHLTFSVESPTERPSLLSLAADGASDGSFLLSMTLGFEWPLLDELSSAGTQAVTIWTDRLLGMISTESPSNNGAPSNLGVTDLANWVLNPIGLGLLLHKLQRGCADGMEAAARVVSTLAADPEKKVALRRHPTITTSLAKLLRKPGHQGQEAAARALWSLAGDDDRTKEFLGYGWLGVLPALISLLQTGSVTARGGAAGALHCLATHPKNLEKIVRLTEAVPALVALLQEGDEEGRREAAGVLEILRRDRAVSGNRR